MIKIFPKIWVIGVIWKSSQWSESSQTFKSVWMGRFGNLPNHPNLPKDLDDWEDLEIFPMIQIFPNIQICDVGTPLSFLEKKKKLSGAPTSNRNHRYCWSIIQIFPKIWMIGKIWIPKIWMIGKIWILGGIFFFFLFLFLWFFFFFLLFLLFYTDCVHLQPQLFQFSSFV